MERYDQRLLATVYWALGGLGTLAAILIGAGWFANFRIYERDKAALARDLQAEMKVASAADRTALFAEIERTSKAAEERTKARLDASLQSLRSQVQLLQFAKLSGEALQWLQRPVAVPENAIRCYCEMISVAGKAQHLIPECLDGLQEALKVLEKLGNMVQGTELAASITAALSTVPSEYGVAVREIHRRLEKIRSL